MSLYKRLLCVSFLLFCCSAVSVAASVRQIRNNSSKPWFFEFNRYSGSEVKFISSYCFAGVPCMIFPGQMVEIIYFGGKGSVKITDYTGNRRTFSYDGHYLQHDGNTGSVTLNDPYYGDIEVESGCDTW